MSESMPPVESERRIVTVMFADISGFTALSEKMDPEQVTCTLNDCFRTMGECIEKHGGTIDKFMGDCVMVLFGVPHAIEDAPQKAVNTAIELKNRLVRFNLEKKLAIPLDIHIGINTGPVVSGMVGTDRKQEFTVMGDTVNLASRLEDASQVGQILVGPATYKATNAHFQYKALPPVTLKGKAEPVPVYELLSKREVLSRTQPGADRMISSAMVGRDDELDRLEFQIMKAVNGEGSIVNVIGEAGIGKSRLISELKNKEIMKRVTLLEGRAISMGANLGYHLVIDLLKNWAQITEDDSEIASFTKLESAVRTIYPEALGEVLPFIATLMGIKLVGRYGERIKGIEGEALERLIVKNVKDLVTRGSQRAPVVVALEDLHWSDTSSIELLESLFSLAGKERIVFINVFRPGYADTGDRITKRAYESYPDRHVEIALHPLDERQTETLIMNLLSIRGFPHGLKGQIIERAGGNPYFIEEVIRSFIDEGAIVMKNGGFEVTDKLEAMVVPRTINEVLMARIDRLDQKTKDLVKTASVIGRNFFYRILAEVAGTVEDLDSRLEYLEEIQLIRERKRMEELEYLFKHALAQEVAYDSILAQRRKEIHKEVADSIEKVFNERLHEFYGMLAYHYSQAEDLDKAEQYLVKAGEESLKASASAEALHYYRQALDLYLKKYGDKADPEKVALLEKSIALALFGKGQLTESIPYFQKALAFYGETIPGNPVLKALLFIASFFVFLVSFYLPFLRWKKTPTQRDKEIMNLYHKYLYALSAADPKEFFFQSLNVVRRWSRFDLAKTENGVGVIASMSAIFSWTGISFALSRKVLDYAKSKLDTNDARSIIYYKCSQLTHDFISGNWPEEIEVDQDLVDKSLEIGEIITASQYLFFAQIIYLFRGDYRCAQLLKQKIFEISERYDFDIGKLEDKFSNVFTAVRFGNPQEALNESEPSIQFANKTGERAWLIIQYSNKALAQLMLGDAAGATSSLESADAVRSEVVAAPTFLPDFLLSRFMLNLHFLEEARLKSDRASFFLNRAKALKAGKEALKTARKYAPMRAEVYKLMGVYFWITGKQRKALKYWRRAIRDATRLKGRLVLSRIYFEVGRRLLEPGSRYHELDGITAWEYLDKARSMFEEMDLQWDLDELEKLKVRMGT